MRNDVSGLYTGDDLAIMRFSEESRVAGQNRVEEIRNYARHAGIRRIGIAHCIGFQKEADKLKAFLADDFEVYAVNCKCGQIQKSAFLKTDKPGVSCNPAGQADLLDAHHTELNIVLGLCLGHDMIFNKKSKAPVTTLLIKDRALKHNPCQWFSAPEY